jgi:hypothetical protein
LSRKGLDQSSTKAEHAFVSGTPIPLQVLRLVKEPSLKLLRLGVIHLSPPAQDRPGEAAEPDVHLSLEDRGAM